MLFFLAWHAGSDTCLGTACTRPPFWDHAEIFAQQGKCPKNLVCRLASPLPQVGAFLAKKELGAPSLVGGTHL